MHAILIVGVIFFYKPNKSRAPAGIAVSRFAAATRGALCAVCAVCDLSSVVVLRQVSDHKVNVSSAVTFWRFLVSIVLGSWVCNRVVCY